MTINKRFLLDVYGRFMPGQVRVDFDARAHATDADIEELKRAWPRHVEEVTARGGMLFNGQMVRYLGHEVDGEQLVIRAGPTDYATFYCTNYLNHALGETIGWERFANPIGISANVITSDGWIAYGRRGRRVACHPETVHAFGGTLEPGDLGADGRLDVFASIARELREELSLAADEPIDLVCLGMIRDPQIRQPELVFDAGLSLSLGELEGRLDRDDPEHEEIVAVRDEPACLSTFLDETPTAVPILVGAVCLHVRHAFGERAYASLARCG